MERGVLILGAGPMQVPAIKEARALGLWVVAVDRDKNAPGFKLAEPLHLDPVQDVDDIFWHVSTSEVDGVFSGGDFAVPAARIAEQFGFPGIPIEVAERTHNKALMKERWIRDGIPTPQPSPQGFPLVVKPPDSSASRGVSIVQHASDLMSALKNAERYSREKPLLEEFVKGHEQSVEMLVDNEGRHRRFGIVDRHFDGVIETGHTNPTQMLSMDEQQHLYRIVEKAARSLGITWGPYKADTIWTKDGPMILEMPARLSGGWHSQKTTPLASGQQPIRAALRQCVGLPEGPDDFFGPNMLSSTAICRALFPKPGVVQSIEGLEEAERYAEVILSVKPGDTIKPYKNCADRVCYLIAHGETADLAEANIKAAEQALEIVTV